MPKEPCKSGSMWGRPFVTSLRSVTFVPAERPRLPFGNNDTLQQPQFVTFLATTRYLLISQKPFSSSSYIVDILY